MRRHSAVWAHCALALAFSLPLTAQTPSTSDSAPTAAPAPAPAPAPSPKPKKVYTEDDLRKLHGGISVVGDTQKPAPSTQKSNAAGKSQFTGMPGDDQQAGAAPEKKEADCPSATFAYALERVLGEQGVTMGHQTWMAKLFGGMNICRPLPAGGTLTAAISGDFVDENGQRIHIKAVLYPDMPTTQARQQAEIDGRHFLLLYKKNAWVLASFDYRVEETSSGVGRTGIKGFNLTDEYHGTSDYMPTMGSAPTTIKASGGNMGHDGIIDVLVQPR